MTVPSNYAVGNTLVFSRVYESLGGRRACEGQRYENWVLSGIMRDGPGTKWDEGQCQWGVEGQRGVRTGASFCRYRCRLEEVVLGQSNRVRIPFFY